MAYINLAYTWNAILWGSEIEIVVTLSEWVRENEECAGGVLNCFANKTTTPGELDYAIMTCKFLSLSCHTTGLYLSATLPVPQKPNWTKERWKLITDFFIELRRSLGVEKLAGTKDHVAVGGWAETEKQCCYDYRVKLVHGGPTSWNWKPNSWITKRINESLTLTEERVKE